MATCQRVVRAQAVPRRPGHAHHFKLFSLATAGRETRDHGFVVAAILEHVRTLLAGLEPLIDDGYFVADRSLADRIAEQLSPVIDVVRQPLEHPYYDGLRFSLDVVAPDGAVLPLADGGAFDWVARLTANRRQGFVASGLGTRLLVFLLRPGR